MFENWWKLVSLLKNFVLSLRKSKLHDVKQNEKNPYALKIKMFKEIDLEAVTEMEEGSEYDIPEEEDPNNGEQAESVFLCFHWQYHMSTSIHTTEHYLVWKTMTEQFPAAEIRVKIEPYHHQLIMPKLKWNPDVACNVNQEE